MGQKILCLVATGSANIATPTRDYHSRNMDFRVAISHVSLSFLSDTPVRLRQVVSLGGRHTLIELVRRHSSAGLYGKPCMSPTPLTPCD